MAEVLKDGEFWLPPEFLTDDDILMGKENFNGNGLSFPPSQFPHELPNSESDEEDISGLTRQFSRSTLQIPRKISFTPSNKEAKWVYSGSPQSTLSAAGSWSLSSNGSSSGHSLDPSPPTTPFVQVEDTRDLIYAAAGQVARMKMNLNNRDRTNENRALIAPHRSLASLNYNNCVSHSLCHHNQLQQMRAEPVIKQQVCPIWGKLERERWLPPPPQVIQGRGSSLGVENGRPMGYPHPASWQNNRQQNQLSLQNKEIAMNRAVYLGGSGAGGCGGRPVKRECAGTGVFIPLNPSESRKKPVCSTNLLHPRNVQANFESTIYRANAQAQAQPNFPDRFIPNYDLLIARRNAAMAQQQQRQNIRPEVMMKHNEVLLPQEWTY